jgi:hypothetical protein
MNSNFDQHKVADKIAFIMSNLEKLKFFKGHP